MWGKKAPGFMLIFIKIILTCNVAAASGRAGHGTSHTGAKGHSTANERGRGRGECEGQSLATNFLVSMQVYLANEQAPLLNVCVNMCVCVCELVHACECKS